LSSRFESAPPAGSRYYCPNNWTKNNGENTPLIPKDDSRVIQLFVEPYDAAVTSQGSAPIQDFATFYVYSWDGDTCKSDEKGPNGESTKAGKGEVIGYFIKYINTLNTKEGGGQKCVLNSLEECTTVLTR
jgi:hypothetical protein